MDHKILAARPVVENIKSNLIRRSEALKKSGVTPSMSVILVGSNPASLSYIRNKKKMCEDVGAKFTLHQLDSAISESEFIKTVSGLNADPKIHGIIIQLPVSEGLKNLDVANLVSPKKDIDGFHGINTQRLYAGSTDLDFLMPCTPKGIVNLLRFYGCAIEAKHVVVIGRSQIVGKPLALLLSNFNATVTLAHSKSRGLQELTKKADIIISAIGKAHFIDESFFSLEKRPVVIDVGMNTLDGKLTGDVDQFKVRPFVAAMSPVPGGVGPMTVISLIENLITATENQLKG